MVGWAARRVRCRRGSPAVLGCVSVLLLILLTAVGASEPAAAAIPPSEPGYAIVVVRVGGDRDGPSSIAGLEGATFGLFTNQPTNYDSFTGFTTDTPLYRCTSDADGHCVFRVPIGAGGVPAGTQLWVAPIDGPPPGARDFWFGNPTWQTAPLTLLNRQQTRHAFQTPALQSGGVYTSGATNFMGPGPTTGEGDTRRKGSSGVWPLSHVDPDLPTPCGLNVAFVVDLSSSMQQSESVPPLKQALNLFVSSLHGTPSQAALFTFSTDTPAVNAGPNTGLLPIASTNDAEAFRSLYSNWTNNTANGYTNWDRALEAVGAENSANDPDQHFDLVVFLTDGLPTVYGPITGNQVPSGSGFTRFREMENAVASANFLKSSGGHIVDGELQGGSRIVAVGVGAGLDPGSDNNLRSISGPIEYDGTNLHEADFFRTEDFEEVGQRLRSLFLSACTPSVTVVKQIVPHGGSIAEAYTPPTRWHFTAQTEGHATVSPTAADTDPATGAINFDLEFEPHHSPVGVSIHEDPRTEDGYTLRQVEGHNAVCVNKIEDDAPVEVEDEGTTGFSVDVGNEEAVSCTVYNEAPDYDAASLIVHKRWRVTTSAGTKTYVEGEQPAGLESRLTIATEGTLAREVAWGQAHHGFRNGSGVTITEYNELQLPGCELTGQTIDGPSAEGRRSHAHRSFQTEVTLGPGANPYTITNEVDCESHLTLIKRVENGDASPSSWLLHAIGPDGALAGPSGTTGVRAPVTPGVDYQLAEEPLPGIPGLANYRQVDERQTPIAHPQSTGSMACALSGGAETPIGDLLGQDGAIRVPAGEDVHCVAINHTAHLTLIKAVEGGTATPADFTFTVTPVGPNPAGAPAQTVAGAGAPGATINVRPGLSYAISEAGPSGYSLAGMICTVDNVSRYGTEVTIPDGGHATCTATNRFGAPGAPPPLPEPEPEPKPTPKHPAPLDPARVTIAKRADRSTVASGHDVTYRIRVRTTSQAPAHSLRVCDKLPPPLVLISAPGGRRQGRQVCWSVAKMPFGGNRTFAVTAHVPLFTRARTIRNVARLTGANVRARTATAATRLTGGTIPPRFTG